MTIPSEDRVVGASALTSGSGVPGGCSAPQAKSGFGGTEWMLSGLFSEGTKRGLSPNRVAEMVSGAGERSLS